jgi:hypothetical protein
VIETPGMFAGSDARFSAQAGDPLAVLRTAAVRCFMGVQVGFHGGSSRFRWPSSLILAPERLRTSSCPRRRAAFPHVREHTARPLPEVNIGAVAYRAMWGYGVGPPPTSPHYAASQWAIPAVRSRASAALPTTPDDPTLGVRISASPIQGSNALVTLILDL